MSKLSEYRDKLRKDGRCQSCGEPLEDTHFVRCLDCRDRQAISKKKSRDALLEKVYHHYGGFVCSCCGETERMFLTLDHIDGTDIPKARSRDSSSLLRNQGQFLRWLKNHDFPPGLRILCFNCNCGRARNGGVCPHKQG